MKKFKGLEAELSEFVDAFPDHRIELAYRDQRWTARAYRDPLERDQGQVVVAASPAEALRRLNLLIWDRTSSEGSPE